MDFKSDFKLPKQWKHWCYLAGLRPMVSGREKYIWFYLKGRGRVWRVNCFGMLQCGDTYIEFDKWALCRIKETSLPTSKDMFLNSVSLLLSLHEKQ